MMKYRPQVHIRFFRIGQYHLLQVTCSYTVLAKAYVFHGDRLSQREFGKLLSNSSEHELLHHARICVHTLEHGRGVYIIVKEQERFGFVFFDKQNDYPEIFAAVALEDGKVARLINEQDILLKILQADHLLMLVENSPTFRSFRERFR